MNLYIWDDPYDVSYGASTLRVIAPNLTEARKLAKKAGLVEHSGEPRQQDFLKDMKLGKPDRVVDVSNGFAEYFQWQE